MNKRFALIALLLAAVMLLSGCNLIGHDDELDGAQVVATVETNQGSTEITKAEWEAYRDYLASYYQQYYQQYFGVTMQLTDDDVKAYGDAAVEQMIESVVLQDKMKELGFEPLPEEDAADVESYADSMFSFYKLMIRSQNYPDLETVEEEEARIVAATADEATGAEAEEIERKATVTNDQLDDLKAEDTSSYDEETKASYDEQVAALEETLATAQTTLDESSAKLETVTAEAYDEILATAEDVLARAQAGEDFDSLIETYGQDTGMNNEPNKSRGYLVCDGLSIYEQSFQDAAMALEKVGDVSAELVKTSYGYHILQYATDIAAGEVEYTDEIKSNIYDTLLSDAKDAAYEAAVTQWVSEAKVTTNSKVMK